MTLPLFTEQADCLQGGHCPTCRQLDAGRGWRERLKPHFSLPGDNVDFVCPHGKPWCGEAGAPPRAKPVIYTPFMPVPRERWPLAARIVARQKGEGDKGVGDTIERLLGTPGRLWKMLWNRLGKDCGCGGRRDRLNSIYSY